MSVRSNILACAIAFGIALSASAHPKPGAHADVRISIEKDAVRFDVLMNILFADQVVNAPRVARDGVTPDEEPALRDAMLEYFGGTQGIAGRTMLVDRPNRVVVDSVDVTPVIRELTIVHPQPETRPGFVQNPALLLPQVHVVAEYPCKALPRAVTMIWGAFPRDFQAPDRDMAPPSPIEAALTSEGTLQLVAFTQQEPEVTWRAPATQREARFAAVPRVAAFKAGASSFNISVPAISMSLVGLGVVGATMLARKAQPFSYKAVRTGVVLLATVGAAWISWPYARIGFGPNPFGSKGQDEAQAFSADQALAVFRPLHANIYRAFDYTRESDIYDALARSVDGPLLDALYNDVYQGLVMQEEGGAMSRVKTVTPLECEVVPVGQSGPNSGALFRVRTRWQVEGVVYHWGHSHTRINEYVADYGVAARDGGWRIVEAVPREQRRLQTPEQAASPAATDANPGALGPTGVPAINHEPWRPNR